MGDELAGRYRLDERLGRGGMGEVWRGHDLNLDRSVAVKVLLEAATGDEPVARFRREATIGARLQHPGITVVHDVGRQDGRLFIVMELLSGEDLAAVLARSPGGLPVATALDLAAQTAEALSAAHAQAVVHRDLKPGNLFLLPGGRLKICDFGIAHSSDATPGWTVTGRMFGTPAYMAPEQWRGERVDARCDLYALGCVLYALLSGEPPFGSAGSPYALMLRHVEEVPAALPVAPDLAALLATLLEKAPDDRPASAARTATALRALERASAAGAAVATGATGAAGTGAPGAGRAAVAGSAEPVGGPRTGRPGPADPEAGPDRSPGGPARTRDAAPPGDVLWRSRVRPQALHAAGDSVVWRTGPEVGSVWAATGAALWTARADEGVPASELPAVSAVSSAADPGAVYVAVSGRDGEGVRVLAREAGDGRVRWWRDLPEPPARTPVLTATGGLVLYGAGGGLTALDAASGETVWRYGVQGTVSRRPTVSGNCLVLADGLLLTALHLPTGKPLWHWPRNTHRGGPRLPGGPVHVTDGKTVRALHRREGHVVWHFDAGTPAPTGLLSLDDTVHVAAHRAQEGWDMVCALDAESGAVRWRRPLVRRQGPDCAVELLGAGPDPHGVRDAPGAPGARDLLYVKAADGGRGGLLGRTPRPPFLAALDLLTGELHWRWEHAGIGSAVRTGAGVALALPELTTIAVP
ncbi:protein kinase [Streptomyces sp. NPDC058623]|uniref:protein kinase domain-containing protein n=1 Tax=Streptomyces sp. NPDC058623 TaxID=3346563 RepID=UPI00365D6AE3